MGFGRSTRGVLAGLWGRRNCDVPSLRDRGLTIWYGPARPRRPIQGRQVDGQSRRYGHMRTSAFSMVLLLVVVACGADGEDTLAVDLTVTTAAPTVTVTETESTEPAEPSGSAPTGDVAPDEVVGPQYDIFLAAVDAALEGTRFADTALEDPEVVAASGLLLCERLDAGLTQDEVVIEYLDELTDGGAAQADDDQLTLAGALVGAAVEALCPQFANE